jgi:hypothetical protein
MGQKVKPIATPRKPFFVAIVMPVVADRRPVYRGFSDVEASEILY